MQELTDDPRRERLVLAGITAVVFVLQVLTLREAVGIGEPYFIAKNINAGFGYSFLYPFDSVTQITSYIPPLYVYLHLLVMKLGGGLGVMQIFGILCFHAANFVVYALMKKVSSGIVPLLGFTAFAFYVPFWIMVQKLDPDGLNMLLIALTVSYVYRLVQDRKRGDWLRLGVLYGIQLALRPDVVFAIVLFGLWIVSNLGFKRKNIRGYALSIFIALLMILPWTIRNYQVFGTFVLVSSNGGYNFYIGNNANATGEFQQVISTPEGRTQLDSLEAFFETHPTSVAADAYLMREGMRWVAENPLNALALLAKKFIYHWFFRESVGSEVQSNEWMQTAYKIASVLVLVFGLIGLFSIRNLRFRSLILTVFLYSTIVSVLFFVQSRHRAVKVDPYLVPMAVIGCAAIGKKFTTTFNRKTQ